jgi:hypothetical protein
MLSLGAAQAVLAGLLAGLLACDAAGPWVFIYSHAPGFAHGLVCRITYDLDNICHYASLYSALCLLSGFFRPSGRPEFGLKSRKSRDRKDLMSGPTGDLGGLGAGASGWASPEIFPLPARYFRARIIFHRCASDLKGEQGQSTSGI